MDTTELQMPNLYEFLDYRLYLQSALQHLRETQASFSVRGFIKRMGMNSSSFLKLVMDGKRNLGIDGSQALCRGLKLSDSESHYFETLVHFNQAKALEQKNHNFQKLTTMHPIQPKNLDIQQYDFLSHWFGPAVLELIDMEVTVRKDAHWIASQLRPRISVREAQNMLKSLLNLKLIQEDPDSGYVRCDSMVAISDGIKSLALTNYHAQMSRMAAYKIEKETPRFREFGTLTLAVSEDDFEELRQEMRIFRRKIHTMIENKRKKPRKNKIGIIQINLQMFFLTQLQDGELQKSTNLQKEK